MPNPSHPYDLATLEDVLRHAIADGSLAAHDFARAVVCGLAGNRVPSDSTHPAVDLEIAGTTLRVDGVVCSVPVTVPLPPAGRLDRATADRGRRWAQRQLGFHLELRRLRCNFVDTFVASRPAVEVLQCKSIGVEALVESARRVQVDEAARANCLRDPDVAPRVVSD